MAPLSVLGQLRHELVRLLDAAAVALPKPRLLGCPTLDGNRRSPSEKGKPVWHVLCRDLQQMEELLTLGVKSVIGDFAELHRCAPAVRMARAKDAEIFLATPPPSSLADRSSTSYPPP